MLTSTVNVPHRNLFINGEWKESTKGKRIPIINPTTEQSIGDIPAGTAEDVDIAVEAARNAFYRNKGKDWARASGAYRANYLRAIASKVTERKSDLAKLESLDCGKPLDEALWDMDDVARCFEYYADLAEALDETQGAPLALPMETFKCHILKEPIGIVGLISPWNYPLLMATWKVAPSMAAGCTAVLKPSELASVTCLELADICIEVNLPPGVLNIVTGLGDEAGAPLSCHPHVDKVAFTGSLETGKKVMTASAQLVKPVSMELGGKSPIIIFEDVDIDKAVEWALFGCFWTNGQICSSTSRLLVHVLSSITCHPQSDGQTEVINRSTGLSPFIAAYGHQPKQAVDISDIPSNQPVVENKINNQFGCFWTNGQICSSTSRLLVHKSISKTFIEKLISWANNIKIADPMEEGCRLGPVISESQYEKIMKFIATAKSEGATVSCGGGRPDYLKRGFYIAPTIMTDVDPSMEIWREEVFGPVLCVVTFETEEEAIHLANNSKYGLAGAILSKDRDRCSRVVKEVRAGIMWINCSQPTFCEAPWGGTKRSGFGRELGKWGLENYLNTKQVTEYISDDPWGWYSSPSKL